LAGRLKLGLFDFKYVALGRALRRADRFCPTSRASASQVMRAYALNEIRCRVVPNGINPLFLNARRDPQAKRGPILFFGRLEKTKGADLLIEALAEIAPPRPKAVLIGRGGNCSALGQRIRELKLEDCVSIQDWKDPAALARQLSLASMAVLPSTEESFGNAMLEAMAVGAPLISTTAGSIPEIVEHERTGLLIEPSDKRALVKAISALRLNPKLADDLGKAARAEVLDRYSWTSAARAFESLYRDIGASP
jgi:glycosyltransferase involved in cell wall biosynthesis